MLVEKHFAARSSIFYPPSSTLHPLPSILGFIGLVSPRPCGLTLLYSYLNASIGSIAAALWAG